MIRQIYKENIIRYGFDKAIEMGLYTDWTPERIKGAFNWGMGTEKDLREHIKDNKLYCKFIRVEDGHDLFNDNVWNVRL